MRTHHLAFSSALAIAIAMALFALASAQPSQDIPPDPRAPIVGKVQTRDRLIAPDNAALIGDAEPKPTTQAGPN